MQTGLKRHGIAAEIITDQRTGRAVLGDVAIAYGWVHEPVFTAYRHAGAHYAYFDMGYFNRKPSKDKGGSRDGHHRLAVNSWDTADTMRTLCPSDRWDALGIEVAPNREQHAGAVLVCGMSEKAAGTHGFRPGQWEAETVATLRAAFPTTEIVDRPKPANLDAGEPIAEVLKRTAIVVSHHSNVAVDALVAGVPTYARKGVGKLVSCSNPVDAVRMMGPIVAEPMRRQILADVAYAQWSPPEMRTGAAWSHIRSLIDAQ